MDNLKGIKRIKGQLEKLTDFVAEEQALKEINKALIPAEATNFGEIPLNRLVIELGIGVNYFATAIYNLIKRTGVGLKKGHFNTLKNQISKFIRAHYPYPEVITMHMVKAALHNYSYEHFNKKYRMHVTLEGSTLSILNHTPFSKEEQQMLFEVCIFRQTLQDVRRVKGRYPNTKAILQPELIRDKWISSAQEPELSFEIDPLDENEIMVIGIRPIVDEFYPVVTGSMVFVV